MSMKVLIISTSRADRNGLEVVYEALMRAGEQCEFDILWPAAKATAFDVAQEAFAGAVSAVARSNPDVVLVGGDRYETLSLAHACSIAGVPIAHLAGGDLTLGSRDDAYRGAISALSDLHLVTTETARDRLYWARALGRIVVTGSPAIDRIRQTPHLMAPELHARLGLYAGLRKVLCIVHPNTDGGDPARDAKAVCAALAELKDTEIGFVLPNQDPGERDVLSELYQFGRGGGVYYHLWQNLAPEVFYAVLAQFDLMIGNSSAGLYEAPSFGIPVVNVGDRQAGRMCAANVFNCPAEKTEILTAILAALNRGRQPTANPYGDGFAAPRIVAALNQFVTDRNVRKLTAKSGNLQ